MPEPAERSQQVIYFQCYCCGLSRDFIAPHHRISILRDAGSVGAEFRSKVSRKSRREESSIGIGIRSATCVSKHLKVDSILLAADFLSNQVMREPCLTRGPSEIDV